MMFETVSGNIRFRYWLVYRLLPDGRISFFRGGKRNGLYIRNLRHGRGDWVWEETHARLFGKEPDLEANIISKRIPEHRSVVSSLRYRGFHGIVETTHLILPRG